MAKSTSVGRKNRSGRYVNTIRPESAEQAMLKKQDEIIDKLNSILAAIEAATDAASLFTALDTAQIKAQLEKIKLIGA